MRYDEEKASWSGLLESSNTSAGKQKQAIRVLASLFRGSHKCKIVDSDEE